MTVKEMIGNIEIDISNIVATDLIDMKEGFEEDLRVIDKTGKCTGFVSWTDIEMEKEEINSCISALEKVIKLYKN
jgi:hypothetical protein